MTRDDVINSYFEWLYNLMCDRKFAKGVSYRKLFVFLHSTEFIYFVGRDVNRAHDGVKLRERYARSLGMPGIPDCLDGPCSVLEMMIALSIRCEETIMDNPHIGDRTKQWFWEMVCNLGLGSMMDDIFDKTYAQDVIDTFLERKYKPNGEGGLFIINNTPKDLRKVEIWYQLCWYLDDVKR